jgi:uncharacterized protein
MAITGSHSALAGLLHLVSGSGGSINARIRIQKEAYLLALQGYPPFRQTNFVYHHFGPFSRELSETLKFAVSAGLLEEKEEAFSETSQRYSYALTDAGRAFLQEATGLPEKVKEDIRFMASQHWRALELAATVGYLKARNKNMSRDEAFEFAKRLKPETSAFSESAAKVLQTLYGA